MEMGAEATRVRFLVLGVGVNLNVPRAAFPPEFRDLATSVAAHCGRPVDRVAFAARLYDTLEAVLDLHAARGFEAVRPRFEARFRMVDRRVRVVDAAGGAAAGPLVHREGGAAAGPLVHREGGAAAGPLVHREGGAAAGPLGRRDGGDAGVLEGRAAGIDADGALWIERDDGTRERVVAGDVTVAK
jgi:biotin-(acetyl-CoA carboxylase) ligase